MNIILNTQKRKVTIVLSEKFLMFHFFLKAICVQVIFLVFSCL